MDVTNSLLTILAATVHDKPVELQGNVEYGEILSMAQAHNILPLVFEKLCEVPDFSKHSEFETNMKKAMEIIAVQVRRTDVFLRLYQAFSEAGLRPIIMKGIICRQLYGELCDHRPSGDEDILIRKADFKGVTAILRKQGFRPEWPEVTERQMEELQEISFCHKESGLVIEVHTNPIGKENDVRLQMNECFQNVFEHPKQMEIAGIPVWTMSDTDHFLFLILHAFKHMAVTGFGIRQVLDILLFYEQNEDTIDIAYVLDMLERVKAKRFFSDLIYLGNRYLGFSFMSFDGCCFAEELLDDLMGNGVFGNMTQAQQISRVMTNAAVAQRNKAGNAHLWQAIFPGRGYLMAGYPKLVERPWLLPIYWMKRWIKFFTCRTQNKYHLALESVDISNRKIELLRKYDVMP